jgi:hypothetical protein
MNIVFATLLGLLMGLFSILFNTKGQIFINQIGLHLGVNRSILANFGVGIATFVMVCFIQIINIFIAETTYYQVFNALIIGILPVMSIVYIFIKLPGKKILQSPGKRDSIAVGFERGMYDLPGIFIWLMMLSILDEFTILPHAIPERVAMVGGIAISQLIGIHYLTKFLTDLNDVHRARNFTVLIDKIFGVVCFILAISLLWVQWFVK